VPLTGEAVGKNIKAAAFVPSRWETVDPHEAEEQAMTTSKWEMLERENKSYKNCKRQLNSFNRELQSIKVRLKQITNEKDLLEEENRKIKLDLENSDEYHDKTMRNMERRFSMKLMLLSKYETETNRDPNSSV